ncbi:alcohol dehydrogenase catalytic domain-containing protein [Streptomyces boncukensis]|uniref:Alcohol dehydrogenase catalytic domain-containing protein n=1 Tax=Streptomyces boncukensis TaxID=2711219 RepID=A0A6G4WSC3_9ACTN|nr:alcohol dehydrogenase catalytic domain-containing protein [Streptomyces boncukensis]NGO67527.1 alcohol dehydrogenase catalytic domain-containing protein [Streptomyces boncukensis]
MRACVWHGRRDVRVEDVADPVIREPQDAVVRVTSSGLCGSDLHLYEPLAPFMEAGDILGHEPVGVVEETGSAVDGLAPGDRVVIPFQIACGSCFMCKRNLQTQCETTQVHEYGTGAALFGYTKLYGGVPGAQAEYLRVPQAHYGPVKVPHGPPDDRFLFLSDVLPTAWQAVAYADVPAGGTLTVLGLGPIGEMACRVALHQGLRVIGLDIVPERVARTRAQGAEVVDLAVVDAPVEAVRALTSGRGPESVVDAVGMEAHGSPGVEVLHEMTGLLPPKLAEKAMTRAGVDRLAALHLAVDMVRRGGTISVSGVYGGTKDPLPMLSLFDKQVQLRMGQANVRRWVPGILPLLTDQDPLGVDDFATHHVPLSEAPQAYATFQEKANGTVKVVFRPHGRLC